MNYVLSEIKKATVIKTFFVRVFCFFILYTNSCLSQEKEIFTKISGIHEELRFISMFTPDTNQEDSINITKDVIFSLMEASFINPNEKQILVICESSLEGTQVHFNFVRSSHENLYRKTKVICPDDNGALRVLNCHYGNNFSVQEIDLRRP